MVKKRIPIGIGFFFLGVILVLIGTTGQITDIGFTGRLSIGGENGAEVNSFFYVGLAVTGSGILVIYYGHSKK